MLEFIEDFEPDSGRKTVIPVEKLLFETQSEFQKIQIYETKAYGKMLVLDGVIQLTESDHQNYHEMLAHVPLHYHPNPESILIIGGGDGGTLAEVLKHTSVKNVTICEIDSEVTNSCVRWIPSLQGSVSLSDSRVTYASKDASVFINDHKNEYDVILVDSSDPIGPAQMLYNTPFYLSMHSALKEDGVVSAQWESMILHEDFIMRMHMIAGRAFNSVDYYHTHVPTYPSGTIGFGFLQKGKDHTIETVSSTDEEVLDSCVYFTETMAQSSFDIPAALLRKINKGFNL